MERFLKFLSELFPTPADASFWWDIERRIFKNNNVGKQNNDTNINSSSSSSSSSDSPAVAEAISVLDEDDGEAEYDDDNDFEQEIVTQLHDDQEPAESSLPSQEEEEEEDEDVEGGEQVVVSRWRCYLCNLTAEWTSGETLNAHLRGKRHRINLTNQLKKKERMVRVFDGRFADGGDGGSVLVRRTGAATWQCIVCDVSCSGKASMVDHLLGKKHCAVVRNHQGHQDVPLRDLRRCLKDAGKEEDEDVMEDDSNIGNDAIGKISAADGGGGDHNQQQQQEEVEAQAAPQAWRRCYLCNVKAAREETLKAHLQGKQHRRKLTNQLSIMEERSVGGGRILEDKSPNVITTVMLTKEGTWKCGLCNVSCKCKDNLVDHLLGKKHAANVNLRITI
ncbi:UBP1-associated proteins 1C [Linum grandiflorum]